MPSPWDGSPVKRSPVLPELTEVREEDLKVKWSKKPPEYWRSRARVILFWNMIDVTSNPDDCWYWKFPKKRQETHSRPQCNNWEGKKALASRVSYEFSFGPFEESLKVCHKCDNGECCNPNHFFLGTQQDNLEDARQKGRFIHKIGPSDAEKIRQLRRDGWTLWPIAREMKCSFTSVWRIVNGKTHRGLS